MNKEETAKILRIISSARGGKNEPDEFTVMVWQSLLPEPFEMVLNATLSLLRNETEQYLVTPAMIVKEMHKKAAPQMTGEDAWEQIHDAYMALKDESDYRKAEMLHRDLPKIVRKLVTPQDLIDFAFHMKSTDIRNYERPRIVKAFDSIAAEEVKMEIGSKSVQEIAEQTAKEIESKDTDDTTKQIGLDKKNKPDKK